MIFRRRNEPVTPPPKQGATGEFRMKQAAIDRDKDAARRELDQQWATLEALNTASDFRSLGEPTNGERRAT